MAKGYRALADVSFPKPIAQISENDWATEGVNYPAGSLIPEDHLTPYVRERAESGDLDHILEPVEDDEFDQNYEIQKGGEPTTGVFIAEHEAEAHALRMGGHIVVPRDQAIEAAAAGQEHARRYQEAVKQHGLDERPMQAHMARAESEEGRVPDHYLTGMETRTGLPHNRGPETAFEGSDEDGEDQEGSGQDSEEDRPAARPRPVPTPSGGPTGDAQMTSDAQAGLEQQQNSGQSENSEQQQ
jgi:hypothetical protein